MSYSMLNNGTAYKSHLTGRIYEFRDSESKRDALGTMLTEDSEVRSAAQKRFVDAGGSAKRQLSERGSCGRKFHS